MTANNLKLCAEGILKQMGLDFTRESVEQDSLLAMTLQHPMVDESSKHDFSEEYFYHEFIFFWFSAIELEAHARFLSKMKLLCEVDLGTQSFDVQSIVQEMQNYALLVPTTRMKEIGITPCFPPEQFEAWHFQKIDALQLLARDAVATGVRAVPEKQPFSAGLASRSTPYHQYLGAFSDAMLEAVGGRDDALFSSAFEQCLLIKRQFLFGDMQELLNEGLARFGINS